ncbi:hypothetical protein PILCRDRAFT_826701 [Piloderma croceum F 1598]|uniref:Uncharacterized protein n=1 Tax=Piloderma croceum (strain F 1598) TaxID=765440 RepID=A0A0C3BFG4_PILCF|nr:hypothetical protein PILCRDRAFT_826701 [Piloderma croceum F 1598]
MGLNTKASAALLFLILYAILFALLLLGFLTRRIKSCSRYGVILFYVTIRLASQSTELALGVVGYEDPSFLVACFVLGAEGYYILILGTYSFLISWQIHNSASDSWLEPRFASGSPWYKQLFSSIITASSIRRPKSVVNFLSNIAHAMIFTGGTMVTRINNTDQRNLASSKALRTTGQAIFLTINIFLILCIVNTIQQSRREHPGKQIHPTLLLLLATCTLLFVRGLYGVMSGVLPGFNYYDPNNYGETGLTSSFIISEYIMGTTMEWASCILLMLTYFTSPNDSRTADSNVYSEGKEDRSVEA